MPSAQSFRDRYHIVTTHLASNSRSSENAAAHPVLFLSNAQAEMLPYQDRAGDPSILGYVDDSAFIRIYFRDGSSLEFGIAEIGASHLINLRQLARMGDGLPQYLHRYELRKLGRPLKTQ